MLKKDFSVSNNHRDEGELCKDKKSKAEIIVALRFFKHKSALVIILIAARGATLKWSFQAHQKFLNERLESLITIHFDCHGVNDLQMKGELREQIVVHYF
jgi:hypothetical protein